MCRRTFAAFLPAILAGLTILAALEMAPGSPPKPDAVPAEKVSALPRLGAFSLPAVIGDPLTLKSLVGCKAVVLLFIDTTCPLARSYAPEFSTIANDYAGKGIRVFGVFPDPDLTAEKAADYSREFALKFPLFLDSDQGVARSLGITIVPEAAILLPSGQLKYRGRIDNWYSMEGERRPKATRHDLRDALDSILAGEDPDPAITPCYGCFLPEPIKKR